MTGHGGIAQARDFREAFTSLLGQVERAARAGREAGKTPKEAAEAFALPPAAAEWQSFSPNYPETAITAWYREWDETRAAEAGS